MRGAPEVEALSPDACRHLLGERVIGRIALPTSGAPVLRPVNYAFDGDAIVIRTGDGTIHAAAQRTDPASFEIDLFDPLEHTGSSVVVSGRLEALESEPASFAPLRAWASGLKDRYVRLSVETLSGIRIPPGRGNR